MLVLAEVSFTLRMKSDDMAATHGAYPNQLPYRKLVELALSSFFLLAEEWRIHRPPPHYEIHKPTYGIVVEKFRPHREEERHRTCRASEDDARDRVHVEKGSMIRDQYEGTVRIR